MKTLNYWKTRLAPKFIFLAALMVLAVAACGGGSEGGGDGGNKAEIRLADAQWETLAINNAIAKFVIEKGFEHPVKVVVTSTEAWQDGLVNGDIDIIMEGWQQNYPEWFAQATADGKVVPLATVYESGPQFFVIPQWVADEYDIRTIQDMESQWELFKDPADPSRGVFHNCPFGGQCAEINPVKVEAYGLYRNFNVADASSYGDLEQTLNIAMANQEPVFAYYWAPTPLMSQFEWHVLEEPGYTKGCWDALTAASGDPSLRPRRQACAYPDPGIQILANTGLPEKAPEVANLLQNMRVGLAQLEETAKWSRDNFIQNYEEAAIHYLNANEDLVRSWMPQENFAKIFRALRELERSSR